MKYLQEQTSLSRLFRSAIVFLMYMCQLSKNVDGLEEVRFDSPHA